MSEKRKRHTASFQLSKFLNSKESLEYTRVTATHVSVLRYMYDVMDMNFNQTGKEVCNKSISQIAIYSRTSEKTVKRSISYLIKNNFLSVVQRARGAIGVYGVGELIKTRVMVTHVYPQVNENIGHGDLPTRVTVTQGVGHGDPYIRTSCKNFYKTKSSTPSDFVFEPNEANIIKAQEYGVDLQENIRTFMEKYQYSKTQSAFADWLRINKEHLEKKKKSKVMVTQAQEPYSSVNKMPFYESERKIEAIKQDVAPLPTVEVKPILNWRERMEEFKLKKGKQHDKNVSRGSARDNSG